MGEGAGAGVALLASPRTMVLAPPGALEMRVLVSSILSVLVIPRLRPGQHATRVRYR